jgi:4-amino-4-deoxy-L-arabinose transferase-like glycosyltransferase
MKLAARARLWLAANRGRWLALPLPSSPLLLLCLGLFFFRLGHRELYSSHEARAAQNAQRMLDTGEFGLPVLFDGQTDLQKPPGFYWLVAAVGWASGGVDAWAARLPAAVGGLIVVAAVFLFLRREGRPVAALVAAVALATAVHFTGIARTARIDVPLTAAVSVSLLAFYRGCAVGARHRLGWHLLSAVAAAGAVMLKGPIGLALIGPTAVAVLFVQPKPHRHAGGVLGGLPLSSIVLGTAIVLALALPWFLWANYATRGEFFRVFFLHHNVARFLGTSPTLATYPFWYYVPRFAIDFLPWTPALALLVVWAVRHGRWRDDGPLRFGLAWFAVVFAVLSTAKFKRADYLLPAFPGAAIALGCAAEGWLAGRTNPRTVRAAKAAFGAVVLAVAAGWLVMTYGVEPAQQAREEKRAFAGVVRSHAPAPHTVLLFRTESHLLAFHLGRPLHTLVEWGELNDRLSGPGPHFVVMPPEYVYPAERIVTARRLVVVAHLADHAPGKPARPLVFLRTTD